MFKIMNLKSTPVESMDGGRGEKQKFVNTSLGTHNLDVHLNRLKPGGGAQLHAERLIGL